MVDINILKCELARLAYMFSGQSLWGLDCDVSELLCKINTLYNYIKIVENTSTCSANSEVWNAIRVCSNEIQVSAPANFCNNC